MARSLSVSVFIRINNLIYIFVNFFVLCFHLLLFLFINIIQVQPICTILIKDLKRHQKLQREAAAAALSEYIRHRYVMICFGSKSCKGG